MPHNRNGSADITVPTEDEMSLFNTLPRSTRDALNYSTADKVIVFGTPEYLVRNVGFAGHIRRHFGYWAPEAWSKWRERRRGRHVRPPKNCIVHTVV